MAVILLYLALRGLDWGVFFATLKGVNYAYIGLLLLWSSISYFLRAMRWRVLLNSQKNISPLPVFWANMVGYLGNNILPARAGELVRAAYVARREQIPVAFVLATGITERLVDLVALVVIGAVSVFWLEAFPKFVQEALRSFAVVAVCGVVFILTLPLFRGRVIRIMHVFPVLSQSVKDKLEELFTHFVEGIQVIVQARRGIPFIVFTVFIWCMDGIGMIIIASALREQLTLLQSFLFIAALGLSSAIPSTPGYVGVYQFVAVIILIPFGFSRETALALILLVQFLNLIVVIFWGGLGIFIESQSVLENTIDVEGDKNAGA
jgi:uncharacterized protein (TIRG00374 family)